MNHYENHVNDYSKSGQDKAGARNTFLAVVVCVVACGIYFSKYADYSLSDLRHIVTQWSEANNQKQENVIQKQNESLTAKEDSERKQNLDNSEKEATKVPLKEAIEVKSDETVTDPKDSEVAVKPVDNVSEKPIESVVEEKNIENSNEQVSKDVKTADKPIETIRPVFYISGFIVTPLDWNKITVKSSMPIPLFMEFTSKKVIDNNGVISWIYNLKAKDLKTKRDIDVDYASAVWASDGSGYEIRFHDNNQTIWWTVRKADDGIVFTDNKSNDVYKMKRSDKGLVIRKNDAEYGGLNRYSSKINGFRHDTKKLLISAPYIDAIDYEKQLYNAMAIFLLDKIKLEMAAILYLETLKLETDYVTVAKKATDETVNPVKEADSSVNDKVREVSLDCPEAKHFTFQKDNKDCSKLVEHGFRMEDICCVPSFVGLDGIKSFPFSLSEIWNLGVKGPGSKITSADIESSADISARQYSISNSPKNVTAFQSLKESGFKLFVGEDTSSPQKLLWSMNVLDNTVVFSKNDDSSTSYRIELADDKYTVYKNGNSYGEIKCVDDKNLIAFQNENPDKSIKLNFEINYKNARLLYSLAPMLFADENPDIKSILFLESLRIETEKMK